MPSPPAQPNVIRVDHHFTVGEDVAAQCRLFMRYTGAPPANADLTTFAIHLAGSWPAALISLMTPDRSLTKIAVTDLSSSTAGYGEWASSIAGSLLEPILPAATCTMMNQHIHRRYRGGKPRTYWPFGSQTRLQDEQTWTPAWLTLVETELNTYMAAAVGQVVGPATIAAWCSVSQYSGFSTVGPDLEGRFKYPPKVRTVALPPDDVISISIHSRPATQRRRALNT